MADYKMNKMLIQNLAVFNQLICGLKWYDTDSTVGYYTYSLPEGREGREVRTQNRKKIVTVHNENKGREGKKFLKERRDTIKI